MPYLLKAMGFVGCKTLDARESKYVKECEMEWGEKVIKIGDGQLDYHLVASRPTVTSKITLALSCLNSVERPVDVSKMSDADNWSTLVGVGADL
jgi:hypothetical protein